MSLAEAHILLVEDDPLVSEHLQTVLRHAGADVTALNSLRQLDAFDPASTDLAVLDVSLGDGEVGDHLEALDAAGVSLLFHTGTDDTSAIMQSHPAARILAKPSREDELLAICQDLMAARA